MTNTSTRQAKIDWLLAHQGLWRGLPSAYQQPSVAGRERLHLLAYAMRQAGLYSPRTRDEDVVSGLLTLIYLARRERRLRTS